MRISFCSGDKGEATIVRAELFANKTFPILRIPCLVK